ncbi:MAG TPA: hypothetical protein VFV83_01910 [Chthoniobacteraceae bacterium]|nr:hypothetical protein [Chthoniobacteraceae bacterium]
MKLLPFSSFLLLGLPAASFAATIASYDAVTDSPYTFEFFGDATQGGPPTVELDEGNPGNYLRLTNNVNGQSGWATFDQTDPGTFQRIVFSFDFRFDLQNNGGADGLSFSFYNTDVYGTTGGVGSQLYAPEDPNRVGVLGFGFDTWGNGGVDYVDNTVVPPREFGADYSEISLFSNGSPVARINDTRTLTEGAFNLKDGAWHTATGVVDFSAKTVSLNVDTTPIFVNRAVSNLVPFSSRVGFAGRTGGANERTSIDNVNVQYGVIPEPASLSMAGLGGILLLRHRRRT